MPVILALVRLRQKKCKLLASLGCTGRLCPYPHTNKKLQIGVRNQKYTHIRNYSKDSYVLLHKYYNTPKV
jgi:hypothetical protein